MPDNSFTHPASGRTYVEDDPAAHFATLVGVLARQCDAFLYHHQRRLKGLDYLAQHTEWSSDPSNIARTMAHTIEQLDKAFTAVVCDRTLHEYGLGQKDDDWQRKYGPVGGES
ncbi:hypothetical protein [Streptomyces sp. NPDC051452]|uniref:hypothetical protein n=1 Tax=Streptomyces sp. NPDC051452 TaxID=3365654 RepID=UPI00379B4CF6